MRIYFLSDYHIKISVERDLKKEQQLLDFFENLKKNANILFLVGDFFDIWYDWNSVIIKEYFLYYWALKDLVKSGCKVIFLSGNHDFLHNGFLEKELGIEVFSKPYITKLDNKKIFVSHGDIFIKNDFRYYLYKKLMKSRFINKIFSILHPHLGLTIGRLMSRSSKKNSTNKKLHRWQENFAKEKIEKENFDYIILGHSHQKCVTKFEKGVYINLGQYPTYLKMVNGDISLKKIKKDD